MATVLAVLRAAQVWGGRTAALPGLRSALAAWAGLPAELLRNENHPELVTVPAALTRVAAGPARTSADALDLVEQAAHRLVAGLDQLGWAPEKAALVCDEVLGEAPADVVRVLEFAAAEVVPRLARTTDEVTHILHALDGGYVPAGPSGSPDPRAGQRAAHRPQLLLGGPQGHPVPQRVGHRRRRWPSRWWPGTWRTPGRIPPRWG